MDPSLPTISINLPLQNLIAIATLLLLAVYIIYSTILYYHWDKYATDGKVKNITLLVYFISTLPLLAIMGIVAIII